MTINTDFAHRFDTERGATARLIADVQRGAPKRKVCRAAYRIGYFGTNYPRSTLEYLAQSWLACDDAFDDIRPGEMFCRSCGHIGEPCWKQLCKGDAVTPPASDLVCMRCGADDLEECT